MIDKDPLRGNLAGGLAPWDAAVYSRKDKCWYGANRGNRKGWPQGDVMRIIHWPNIKTFIDEYPGSFITTFVFVTTEGGGTKGPREPFGAGIAN